MTSSTCRRLVTKDTTDLLGAFLEMLDAERVAYCVIGGQAVNAYVDPLVSLDLDVVVAVGDAERMLAILRPAYTVQRFQHSLSIAQQGSDLRIQVKTDPR